jgi:hypothetical protein
MNADDLRKSPYHEELGEKLYAAFLAQQQGIAMNTALKKIDAPIPDEWLFVAEFATRAHNSGIDSFLEWTEPTSLLN